MLITYFVFVFVTSFIVNSKLNNKIEKEKAFQTSFKIDGKVYCFRRPCSMKKNLELRNKFANGRKIEPLGRFDCARYYIDNDTFEVTKI